MCDTARVVRFRTDTVRRALRKKAAALASVNTALLRTLHPDAVAWTMERAGAAAVEALWSFVGKHSHLRWRWHAIDHHIGTVFASVFDRRQDEGCVPLKALLEPCGLTHSSTDDRGAYTRHLAPAVQSPGPRQTQQREHKPL